MLIALVSACTEPEAQSAGATAHDQGGGSELSPLEEYLGEGAVSFEGGFGLSMDGSSTGGPFTLSDDQLRRRKASMAEAGSSGMDGIGDGQTLVSNRVDEVLRIEGSEALLPWSEADPESLRELQEFEDAFREVRTELEAAASPKLGCPRAHRRVTLLR